MNLLYVSAYFPRPTRRSTIAHDGYDATLSSTRPTRLARFRLRPGPRRSRVTKAFGRVSAQGRRSSIGSACLRRSPSFVSQTTHNPAGPVEHFHTHADEHFVLAEKSKPCRAPISVQRSRTRVEAIDPVSADQEELKVFSLASMAGLR